MIKMGPMIVISNPLGADDQRMLRGQEQRRLRD